MGTSRKVALNVPHWLLVPRLLSDSSMVSVLSERYAKLVSAGLVLHGLPFPGTDFNWSLYWHRRYDATPVHCWLREMLNETARDLAADS